MASDCEYYSPCQSPWEPRDPRMGWRSAPSRTYTGPLLADARSASPPPVVATPPPLASPSPVVVGYYEVYYEATTRSTTGLLRGYYEATRRSTTRLLQGYYQLSFPLAKGRPSYMPLASLAPGRARPCRRVERSRHAANRNTHPRSQATVLPAWAAATAARAGAARSGCHRRRPRHAAGV